MPVAAGKFPKLTTDRLNLRAPTAKDAALLRGLLSIAAVTRFSNWPDAPSQIQCERYAGWMSKLHTSGKGCAWLIEDRGSKSFIGAIRFNTFHKKWKHGEIGYESHPDFWGRAPMPEALPA